MQQKGEADANGDDGAIAEYYGCQFPAMIADWRLKWSQMSDTNATFPFGFVQLSVWDDETKNQTCGNNTVCTDAAIVRWGQTGNYGFVPNENMTNTFMATAIDLGDPTSPWNSDIHSRYKQQVAERLSNAGKNVIYGESDVYWMGPVAEKSGIDNDNARLWVEFRNVQNEGLMVKNSDGFEVYDCMKDLWVGNNGSVRVMNGGDYVGFIVGGGVNISCVTEVRYNWYTAPCDPDDGIYNCGIYDKLGMLPATPFVLDVGPCGC